MCAASPEDELVEAYTDGLRNLDLQVVNGDSSVHDDVVFIDVVLAVEDLLGRDRCFRNVDFRVLV